MSGYVTIQKKQLKPSKKYPEGKERTRYYVIVGVDGLRQGHGSFGTLADARKRKRQLESQLAEGTYGIQRKDDPLFKDYFADWWKGKSKDLKPGARRAYEGSFTRYILPFFGKMKINQITPADVQRFIDSLALLSSGYSRTIYAHFHTLIKVAEDRDDISKTPCRGLTLPKVEAKKSQYLEPGDVWALLDATSSPVYRTLFGVLALTGMRVGECLALRRKNIDTLRKSIKIDEAWNINTREFHTPKTSGSRRKVDLMDSLAEILMQYFEWQGEGTPDDLLFPSPDNPERPLSYQTIRGVFVRTLKKAGLPAVNIHSLRHSFASILLSAGVSVNSLARNLGHSSPDITWRVYAHEVKEGLGDALERADALFRQYTEPRIIDLNARRGAKGTSL